jgi:hypothetical protein
MKKGVFLWVFLFVVLIGFVAPILAQNISLDNTIDQIQNNPDKINDINYNYLADEWKAYLLKNPFMAEADTFFTQINWLFVILFARSWSLSLEMGIVFLVWMFTLFSALSYMRVRTTGWGELGLSLAITILIAYIQVYNVIARLSIKLIFYKTSWVWSLLSSLILFVVLYLYLYFNKMYAKSMLKAREDSKKKDLKAEVEANTEFRKQLSGR